MNQQELSQQFNEKVRSGMFNPVLRHLTDENTAEDYLQDAVCQTWQMYTRYAEKGKILDDALLVHACKLRAIDLSRRFVGSNGAHARNQDVLDKRPYRDGKIKVLRIDGFADEQSPDGDRQVQIGWAEAMSITPEREMNSALDLEAWVGDLPFKDQDLMKLKYLGHGCRDVTDKLDLPYMPTYRRIRQLGIELAARAGVHPNQNRGRRGRPRQQSEAA